MGTLFRNEYVYISSEHFEEFYRGVVESAMAYREFLKTLPNVNEGLFVRVISKGNVGAFSTDDTRQDRWVVEFRDTKDDGINVSSVYELGDETDVYKVLMERVHVDFDDVYFS